EGAASRSRRGGVLHRRGPLHPDQSTGCIGDRWASHSTRRREVAFARRTHTSALRRRVHAARRLEPGRNRRAPAARIDRDHVPLRQGGSRSPTLRRSTVADTAEAAHAGRGYPKHRAAVAGGGMMLTKLLDEYLALRRATGFKFHMPEVHLR